MRLLPTVIAVAGVGSAAMGQSLWFTATGGNQIWQGNIDGSGAASVLYAGASDGSAGPTGLDVDPVTGDLFWGTGNHGDFWSGNADGSGAGFFADATSTFDEAHGAAVDRAGGRVFLLNDTFGLFSINADGTGLTDLGFAPGATNGLEFDAANNRLLVAQQFVGVWEVAPDGSSSNLLVADAGNFGVREVASNGSSIFWVDITGVWQADADGGNPRQIADSIDGGNLRSVDAAGGTLFLAEFGGTSLDTIWSIDLATGAETVLYQGDFGSIRGVTVVPAPAGLSLVGLGGLASLRRRR